MIDDLQTGTYVTSSSKVTNLLLLLKQSEVAGTVQIIRRRACARLLFPLPCHGDSKVWGLENMGVSNQMRRARNSGILLKV